MSGYRWIVDVASGALAIWKGKEDTLPFSAPLDHLDRVLLHSGLDYIQIIDSQIFTLNLPARTGAFTEAEADYPLYQHGKAGFPFVLGAVPVGGQLCAFTGSIPIQLCGGSAGNGTGFARWISLGADDTWVYAYEYTVNYYSNSSFRGQYAAISVPITVFMTNELFE